MNILYLYAHPNERSFNHSLKVRGMEYFLQHNCQIKLTDLYADKFQAIASWDDFYLKPSDNNNQYFLAQQAAYSQQTLAKDIVRQLEDITWADHLLIQFPLWWFSAPAILKGWFDRTLVKGFAYDAGKIFNDGLLKGKTASLVVSTQSPESAYQADGVHAAAIDVFLQHIHHTLRFVGIKPLDFFVTYNAFNIDAVRFDEIVKNYHHYLQTLLFKK